MNKKTLVVSITVIVGFVILAYFSMNKPEESKVYPELTQIRKTEASDSASLKDHTQGKGKHILVEYSDLQCPACRAFHEYIRIEKTKDKAFGKTMEEQYTFVFRHFPLTNIHQNSELAAKAAEASSLQGKFFEYIDVAFANQNEWAKSDKARAYFISIAKNLGLDVTQFEKDMESETVQKGLQADVDSATRVNVDATPTFYIDGRKVSGYGNFEEFKQILIDASK